MGEPQPRQKFEWNARTVVLALIGVIVGASVTAGLMSWKPAAGAPLVFALAIILGALVVVGARSGTGGRVTRFVGLAGVGAVVLAPFLGALGVEEPVKDVIGVVGAVAALVTLVLVQRQIDIAQDQVGIALREIKLVEEDLAYSREQSEFTRAQVAELTRRPRLTVAFTDGDHRKDVARTRGRHMFSADLLVRNTGDRTVRDAYIEALIPWSVLDHQYSDVQILRHADTELLDGIAHRRFGKQITEPIYRDLGRPVSVFSESLAMDPESFSLRWRLRDDYGVYPQDEQWGRLEVRVPPEGAAAARRYTPRWQSEPYPMLGWDRSGPDGFIYSSLSPDESEEVAIIDAGLQRRIEDLVWSIPGLAGTTPVTGEIGVEFTMGDPAPLPVAPANNAVAAANAYERGRHRCFVRADGAVEVRMPQDDSHPVFQILRVIGAAYAIARGLHRELGTEPRARGRLAYKLTGLSDAPIGAENDRWIEMRLGRDEFVEEATPLIMALQRAGRTPPIEAETRSMIEKFWAPYRVQPDA
jgi:hypothetical protein